MKLPRGLLPHHRTPLIGQLKLNANTYSLVVGEILLAAEKERTFSTLQALITSSFGL